MIVIDLPRPTSANRLWRSGNKRVFKSKEYISWIKEATVCWMQQKPKQKIKSIRGHYAMTIIVHRQDDRRRDIGNLEKACSDFAQAAGIIEDDYLCARQVKEYGTESMAPLGVRLILEPVRVTTDWVIIPP
jgi:Holliday junction resolvase RusA-like endonuclease